MNHFKGKRVVVTGAGGSIGSKLCELLVQLDAAELKLLSLTESGLYNVTRKLRALRGGTKLVPILGSITNGPLVSDAVEGADIVIHAAAHKHVPICEDNPLEAISNNVFGTQTLLRAVMDRGVQFLQISSDKAVKPASIMGATKRVCELLVMKAARTRPDADFSIVRFGNVLDSAGSVLPLWREQLANNQHITVTDIRCTRYFMSILEACELVLKVIEMQRSGLFVFDMGEQKNIYEMACNLVRSTGGNPETDIKLIGLRPGEKLVEELDYGGERLATSHPKIFEVIEPGGHLLLPLRLMDELEGYVKTRMDRRAVDTLMEIVQ